MMYHAIITKNDRPHHVLIEKSRSKLVYVFPAMEETEKCIKRMLGDLLLFALTISKEHFRN